MKQIVCIGGYPWGTASCRTQKLFSAFEDASLLYFESNVPEYLSRECVHAGRLTYIYTLPQVPPIREGMFGLSLSVQKRLLDCILSAMSFHRIKYPILWICSPLYAELVRDIPHSALVYECDREWEHIPVEMESELATGADLVIAASAGIEDRLSPCSDRIEQIMNGIDYASYSYNAVSGLKCPNVLRFANRPVFGYAGTIWRDLNLTPALEAAYDHPDYSFIFVGDVSKKNDWVDELRTLPNVHFTGPRPLQELPAYISNFDVGMSFIRDSRPSDDVLPGIIFEYMAVGIPIVAMYHTMHLEEFPRLIESAYSPEMFSRMCDRVLSSDDPDLQAERRLIASQADWYSRSLTIRRTLEAQGVLM